MPNDYHKSKTWHARLTVKLLIFNTCIVVVNKLNGVHFLSALQFKCVLEYDLPTLKNNLLLEDNEANLTSLCKHPLIIKLVRLSIF